MNITGKITGIKYKVFLEEELNKVEISSFDINEAPSSVIVKNKKQIYAVSKWVSPKRTRSYPYERIYNTLHISKKITVIPIVKDEGQDGDRDYLQWDTISLMSLLDVFIIFAYYNKTEKKNNKITNQKFDNDYILAKINEIQNYHSSALHWNLNELNTNLHFILEKVKTSYKEIEKKTKVKLHSADGLDKFKEKIGKDVEKFMLFSREKAKQAQAREFVTLQPKESLSTATKAKITIINYLGGLYQFTVDEIEINKKQIYLIESKHSKNSKLPSKGDIKDGLIKMILYSNLSEVFIGAKKYDSKSILKLTSPLINGSINTKSSKKDISSFFVNNKFSESQIKLIESLFEESKHNNFIIKLEHSK